MTSISTRTAILCVLGLVALQAFALYLFSQPPICTCGYVKLWEGVVSGSGNSQHLTDWYTFSHIIHGFIFYLGLWYLFPRLSVWQRLVLAVGIEVSWEILENTPMIVQHYRAQALSQGYTGDAIINSVSDSLAMALGFFVAWRLPVLATISIALGLEIFVAYEIRDNLALNIINLIYIFPPIAAWQSGA